MTGIDGGAEPLNLDEAFIGFQTRPVESAHLFAGRIPLLADADTFVSFGRGGYPVAVPLIDTPDHPP